MPCQPGEDLPASHLQAVQQPAALCPDIQHRDVPQASSGWIRQAWDGSWWSGDRVFTSNRSMSSGSSPAASMAWRAAGTISALTACSGST